MPAKKRTTKKTTPKTLRIGTFIPTPPSPRKPPKTDIERIEDALSEINSTLSYRLEQIEDNINANGWAFVSAFANLERAIRNEPREES